ncbi:hypothetical protein C2E23DRAFT_710598, partial [Lenzites betulinus]
LLQITDSRTVMDAVTVRRRKYEDEGFIMQKNRDLTRAIIGATLARRAHSAFLWVKGHRGHPANEAADKLAARGASRQVRDDVSLEVPRELSLTGAKLSCVSQKLAYHAIRAEKASRTPSRPSTDGRVQQILADLQEDVGVSVTPAALWRSLRSVPALYEARQWLWMSIHDGYMIGSKWLRGNMPPELQLRATCAACQQTESMEHVLFTCTERGRATIWRLLRGLW